ncbi:hypothetical protein BT96DRAFT_1041273, partial [Gymnopus androsaceus JB14]
MAWATVQPRKLHQHIDGLLNSTKEMLKRMRQYSAFDLSSKYFFLRHRRGSQSSAVNKVDGDSASSEDILLKWICAEAGKERSLELEVKDKTKRYRFCFLDNLISGAAIVRQYSTAIHSDRSPPLTFRRLKQKQISQARHWGYCIPIYPSDAELQYFMGTSVGVYSDWARKANAPIVIDELEDRGKLGLDPRGRRKCCFIVMYQLLQHNVHEVEGLIDSFQYRLGSLCYFESTFDGCCPSDLYSQSDKLFYDELRTCAVEGQKLSDSIGERLRQGDLHRRPNFREPVIDLGEILQQNRFCKPDFFSFPQSHTLDLGEMLHDMQDILAVSDNLDQIIVTDKVEPRERRTLSLQVFSERLLNLAQKLSESLETCPNTLTDRVYLTLVHLLVQLEPVVCKTKSVKALGVQLGRFAIHRAYHGLYHYPCSEHTVLLINKTVRNVIEYNFQHSYFPLPPERVEQYVTKRLLVSIVWAFSGDAKLDLCAEMGDFLRNQTGIDLPPLLPGSSLIDYDIQVSSGEWVAWQGRVPTIEIEAHAVTAADVVVPTMDTVCHKEVLLSEHKPLMLCGPPGSGKTMTLFSALRKLPDMEVVGLNFSSATTPELILKTFEQYCEYRKTPNGVILAPIQIGRWLVVFCDEINLPAADKYRTQRVISFIRQLVESGGYWRASDMAWVKLERIQFLGACNPPTDPGRVPLSHCFLRHAPLVMVEYPGEVSLKQIYGTYNRAALKVVPNLRTYAEPLTDAMVSFYLASQKRYTTDAQAHCVYSPRELTQWVRGIYEAIRTLEILSVEGLVQ